jgi:hypothetical protein
VPRKKAKFVNFVRNSFRYLNANDAQLDEIWNVIESFDKKEPNNGHQKKPTKDEEEEKKCTTKLSSHVEEVSKDINNVSEMSSSSKKRKLNDEDEIVEEFDWVEEVKKICSKQEGNEIALEKLQKKVDFLFLAAAFRRFGEKKKCQKEFFYLERN